ncbi:serine/threonine-protein kinase [Streptomyces endophytica]|uniref:Serine/threonine-protein kinase n=1 Tax=Streptomyces endophytica TaxID=2991496 RepID=A0ABY6PAF8_9ACTN|nr:serine/threonine-protein kinase [Streptomyces endophytica]UZJ30172.1 serine/threonine-protein kinase [Streptomyces endophytica]
MPALRDSGVGPEAERPEYAGKYRLEARLGAGGMGVVHLARSSSGLLLAVKVIHAEFAQDPEFRGRFRQEVAAARRVSGAFTAPVVDADPDAGRPWMATLHIPGPTLSDHVKRNGPLTPGEVRRLAAGLAEALRDIHRAGVVHRDLKPGNVLLAADGPKVIDFGISRPSDSDMRTETGKLIGTPPFMAPEQFQRPREVGPAADVFALGSVLVHAATGRGPFDSESPYIVAYQVVHDDADLAGVPRELVPLIESCLAKEPADRPTPDALMELLRTDAPEVDPVPGAVAGLTAGVPPGEVGAGGAPPPADRMPSSQAPGPDPGARRIPAPAPAPAPGSRIPEQRGGTVRAAASPSRAETTHVRAVAPVPAAVPEVPAPTGTTAPPDSPAPPRPPEGAHRQQGPNPHHPRRRAPLSAVALAVTVAVAAVLAGVRLLSPGSGQDPALQTHPPHTATGDARPWRTTILPRPPGHDAEMAYCSGGSGAVFCGQSGLPAARLDPDTGHVAWRHKGPPAGKRATTPTAPVLSGGLLYVFSADGTRLSALDPSPGGRGATRWSKDVSGYEGGATVLGDRVLLTASDGTVTALDSATHRQRWHKRFAGHQLPLFTAFAGAPRTAYAAEPTADGTHSQVTAIDPATGAVRWAHRLPGLLTPAGPAGVTGPAHTGGAGTDGAGTGGPGPLFLTVTDPKLSYRTTAVLRYDPATGRTRTLPVTGSPDQVSAVVHGETVYLLGEGGALQATGAHHWYTETSVSRGSVPVVSGGRLFFSAADGRLIAVDTANGGVVGQTRPRLSRTRSNGFLETVPAPWTDARRGRIYAAAPDGTVFSAPLKDPASW